MIATAASVVIATVLYAVLFGALLALFYINNREDS